MRVHRLILHIGTLWKKTLESGLVVSKMLFKMWCVCVWWGNCIISYTVPRLPEQVIFFFQGKSLCKRSVNNITSLKSWRFGHEPGVCKSFAQGRDGTFRSQAPWSLMETLEHTQTYEKQDKC